MLIGQQQGLRVGNGGWRGGGGFRQQHIKQGEVMLELPIYHSIRGVDTPPLVKYDCQACKYWEDLGGGGGATLCQVNHV